MRTCTLCGKPGGNLEHIIAKWLIERMGAEDYPVVVALRKEDSLTSRPAHKLNTYATRSVCKDCNNGWMSELEGWFQQNMGPLVEPSWPRLANDHLRLALKQRGFLARWALKTAVMMDSNTLADNVVSSTTAQELYEDKLASDIVVDIGCIHDRNVGGIISQGFWVMNASNVPAWQQHSEKLAFKVVIQLNHLAIRVLRAPGAKVTYYAPNKRLPLRAYPDALTPDTVNYHFHNLFEFDEALVLQTTGLFVPTDINDPS
jgi:hypothetical protein